MKYHIRTKYKYFLSIMVEIKSFANNRKEDKCLHMKNKQKTIKQRVRNKKIKTKKNK